MRVFYIISLLLITYAAEGQVTTFKLSCLPPLQEEEIERSDTARLSPANNWVVSHYGKSGRLIRQVTLTNFKNTDHFDLDNLMSAQVRNVYYDSAKRVVYESISENNITFHCYTYRYNKAGLLIYKEGFSSGEIGVKNTYEYDRNGKLIKETIERAGGKIIRGH